MLGAVVPIYNLSGVSQPLKFTGPLLAGIVLGKVKKWNDPAIAKLNPGVEAAGHGITFVHRSDGSGTTFVFADYLAKSRRNSSPRSGVDASVEVAGRRRWQGQRGGRRAGRVRRRGRSAMSSSVYAVQNKIAVGRVQNDSGAFINAVGRLA